jgi:hypothetical protein
LHTQFIIIIITIIIIIITIIIYTKYFASCTRSIHTYFVVRRAKSAICFFSIVRLVFKVECLLWRKKLIWNVFWKANVKYSIYYLILPAERNVNITLEQTWMPRGEYRVLFTLSILCIMIQLLHCKTTNALFILELQ